VTHRVEECDVLVVGGGPSGSTTAQLLAAWGRTVTIVHRPPPAHLTLAESLPASTRKLLRFLGQLEAVDAAGFYTNTGNRADWARQSRATTSAEPGYHVSRGAFDRVLLEGARTAGARVIEGTVQRVDVGDLARVTAVAADGTSIDYRARYVADCSGRAGVIARHGLRRHLVSYRTLAIVAEWECDDWPAEERTCTTIESFADGWAWSVPLSATRRQCTVMVDPPSPARSRPGFGVTGPPSPARSRPGFGVTGPLSKEGSRPLFQVYEEALAKATTLAARLAKARRVSAPWTCDASLYDAARAGDRGVLLVGDAASFIEPLSSAGVKKALLSAWRAAVVLNTCLIDPAMAGPAIELHVRREREVYDDCLRRSSAFFAEASAAYATPFWSARAQHGAGAGSGAADPEDMSDDLLGRDDSIRAAFDRLRTDSIVHLRPAAQLQFAPVPAIDGRVVVMREGLIVPGLTAPLQYAAGVDLARLARIVSGCGDVPAIIEAYQHDVGPTPVAGLLTGLSLLVARHALVAVDR